MAVSIEIKGTLARLLATENLIVEHRDVETACFDVERRLLTLPQWDRASETVYDMLVAHEVGHALFTPVRNWILEKEYFRVPPDYVNVVEDARIEKLMKRKFAGLSRDFFNGYQELNGQDFFGIEGIKMSTLKPIDKINLYFKVGNFVDIEFTDEENEFITRITKAEDFEEVLIIAKDIQSYTKKVAEEKKKQQEEKLETPQMQSEDSVDSDMMQNDPDSDNIEEGESEDPTDSTDEEREVDWTDELDKSETQSNFSDKSSNLIGGGEPTTYVNLPTLDYDKTVVTFDSLLTHLSEHYGIIREQDRDNTGYGCRISDSLSRFSEFKRNAAKEVNYLVKEFEMKKSADAYARATTSRTGVLNTGKLHTYKYNEDLFKKVTTIPDGKNHGLVFYLDWSGSMQNVLLDTMKQLFQLVWFCQKVNIPFEVYAFTNDSWGLGNNYDPTTYVHSDCLAVEWKEYDLNVDGAFRMVNMLTSNARKKQLDEMMGYLWTAAESFNGKCYVPYPPKFTLSGTPLNEAIMCTKMLVNKMKTENKVQKCHVIVLTDGEGYSPSYNVLRRRYHDSAEENKGRVRLPYHTFLRDIKSGRNYSVNDYNFTLKLIQCMKNSLPGVSFIGFRILGRGDIRSFAGYYGSNTMDSTQMQEEIRKKGSVTLKMDSYDLMFGIPQSGVNTDTDLNVNEGAKKGDVSKAFRKMFKGKKTNKFVLQQFANQIS